tara:strand:+ start:613 stop:1179 length:567 start_codon:yes stop_codon:yes gene_type:complete
LNFLGHLYFSGSDYDLMYANLFGDFVKGSNFSNYSQKVIDGIKLHRSIDDYFNRHESILKVQRELYSELPKISGIAMDLYADHWLSKNWSSFHYTAYEQYLEGFYLHNPFLNNDYSKDFEYFIGILKSRRWMNDYPKTSGLDFACKGLSKRLSFSNNLDNALIYYKKYEDDLNISFDKYFKDAIKEFL